MECVVETNRELNGHFQPSHFLPRFSTLKWGLCVPHGCSSADANEILNDLIAPYNITGIKLFVDIDKDDCFVKSNKFWLDLLKDSWQMKAAM